MFTRSAHSLKSLREMLSPLLKISVVVRYLLAVLLFLIALAIRWGLRAHFHDEATYLPFMLPVFLASWLGIGPGVLNLSLGLMAGNQLSNSHDPIQTLMFAVLGGSVLVMNEMFAQSHAKERSLESLFSASCDEAAIGIAQFCEQGKFILANKKLCEITGYTAEELIGRSFVEITHPDDAKADVEAYRTLATGKEKVMVREKRYIRKDEAIITIKASVSVVWLPDNPGVPRYTAVIEDITEQKRRDEQLLEYTRGLQTASNQKDEFLAMLAHELRNPMAAIMNSLYLVRHNAEVDERLHKHTEILTRQVQHQARLVDDLLDVSRITQKKVDLRLQPLQLEDVLAAAINTARPSIDAHAHTLTLNLPEYPIWINGDATRLEQIFNNLLVNASKYTQPGGQITVNAFLREQLVVIQVIDTGMGLSKDLLPRVFDLFTQGDRSLDRSQGGLGLGLNLVKKLAEMHYGFVYAESPGLGKGSTFTVELPFIQAPHKPQEIRLDTADPSIHVGRVLLVEDNRDAAESLAEVIELWGHDVQWVDNGKAALERVSTYHPDVVVMDIGLPLMDGYEVARALKMQPNFNGTYLIALTGYGQESDRARSKEVGFHVHLTKPVNLSLLQAEIEKGLS